MKKPLLLTVLFSLFVFSSITLANPVYWNITVSPYPTNSTIIDFTNDTAYIYSIGKYNSSNVNGFSPTDDYFIMKTELNGNYVSFFTTSDIPFKFGSTGAILNSIKYDPVNNVVYVSGRSNEQSGSIGIWKLDTNLNLLWNRTVSTDTFYNNRTYVLVNSTGTPYLVYINDNVKLKILRASDGYVLDTKTGARSDIPAYGSWIYGSGSWSSANKGDGIFNAIICDDKIYSMYKLCKLDFFGLCDGYNNKIGFTSFDTNGIGEYYDYTTFGSGSVTLDGSAMACDYSNATYFYYAMPSYIAKVNGTLGIDNTASYSVSGGTWTPQSLIFSKFDNSVYHTGRYTWNETHDAYYLEQLYTDMNYGSSYFTIQNAKINNVYRNLIEIGNQSFIGAGYTSPAFDNDVYSSAYTYWGSYSALQYNLTFNVYSATETDVNGCSKGLNYSLVTLINSTSQTVGSGISDETKTNACYSNGGYYDGYSSITFSGIDYGTYNATFLSTNYTFYSTGIVANANKDIDIYLNKPNQNYLKIIVKNSTNALINNALVCVYYSNGTMAFNHYQNLGQNCVNTGSTYGYFILDKNLYYRYTVSAIPYLSNTSNLFYLSNDRTDTVIMSTYLGTGNYYINLSVDKTYVNGTEPVTFTTTISGTTYTPYLVEWVVNNTGTGIMKQETMVTTNNNPAIFTSPVSWCGDNRINTRVTDALGNIIISNQIQINVIQPCSIAQAIISTPTNILGIFANPFMLWTIVLVGSAGYVEHLTKSKGIVFTGILILGAFVLYYFQIYPVWIPILFTLSGGLIAWKLFSGK